MTLRASTSAIKLGEIDLIHAEAEGRRLTELKKAVHTSVKVREKALRVARVKAGKEGSSGSEADAQEKSLQLFLQQP